MKDTEYFDKESGLYSQKRYPEIETQYVHFFFKRRLAILLKLIAKVVSVDKNTSLLEIGCADGFVLSAIAKKCRGFDTLVGIDISSQMIDIANEYNIDSRTHYYVRDEHDFSNESFDVIVEVGVLNLTDLNADLVFARNHLNDEKYYICSLASSTSLITKLKPNNKNDYKHLKSFSEYENILSKFFVIEARVPYGLFVPHIWKVPVFARLMQPIVEWAFCKIMPNAFHEKIYLLKKIDTTL